MLSAEMVGVCVKDHTGDCQANMQLPVARTISQVRPRILERLALPLEEDSGEPISWALYNESLEEKPYLEDSQTVGEVLSDGQTVRVVPEIIAGSQ